MTVSLLPYGSSSEASGYIAWTPVPMTISNTPNGKSGGFKLSSRSKPGSVSKIQFLLDRTSAPQPELTVSLQPGENKTIYIAGVFQRFEKHFGASSDGKDVIIEGVWDDTPGEPAAAIEVMIRVRKDANELTDKARDDFLFALAKLNGIKVDDDPTPGAGYGIYVTDFVEMHVGGASASQHGDSHFVPWHRLYLLDLERQLQKIRPEVTLPYWRFDQAAPNLFSEHFMGAMQQIPRDISVPGGEFDPGGFNTPPAKFNVNNPIAAWQIYDTQGINRTARFNPVTEPANGLLHPNDDFVLLNQGQTLDLGGGENNPDDAFLGTPNPSPGTGFARMESSPHGAAHVSFNGPINRVPVAPRDPLFFLLHCNVDRLWALWQNAYNREDVDDQKTYPYRAPGDASPWELLGAQQWPWNGGSSQPDGLAAPGTRSMNFPASDVGISQPGVSPTLADAIDPFAQINKSGYIGFAYEDVPYKHSTPAFV